MKPKDNLAPMDLEAQLAASLMALPACDWCGKPVGRINKRHPICKRVNSTGYSEWQVHGGITLRHDIKNQGLIINDSDTEIYLLVASLHTLRDVLAVIIEDQRRFDEKKGSK